MLRTTFSLPLEQPPVPISATFSVITGSIVVTFDKALTPDAALDTKLWSARKNSYVRTIANAVASGSTVTMATTQGAFQPGLDVVSYAPPPFDLLGLNGRPVEAFLNYPLA